MNLALTAILSKECIICEEDKKKGIHLYNGFICDRCEQSIIQTNTDDPQYSFYLKQLRKIQLSKPQ